MSNYTDQQLKLALAKMLPEKIRIHNNEGYWLGPNGGFVGFVKDTEWLHICWLVEQELTKEQAQEYGYAIALIKDLDVAILENAVGGLDIFNCATASWQTKALALCKVKGVEVV